MATKNTTTKPTTQPTTSSPEDSPFMRMVKDFGDLNPVVPGFSCRVAADIGRGNASATDDYNARQRKDLGGARGVVISHRQNVRDTMAEYGISPTSEAWKIGLQAYATHLNAMAAAKKTRTAAKREAAQAERTAKADRTALIATFPERSTAWLQTLIAHPGTSSLVHLAAHDELAKRAQATHTAVSDTAATKLATAIKAAAVVGPHPETEKSKTWATTTAARLTVTVKHGSPRVFVQTPGDSHYRTLAVMLHLLAAEVEHELIRVAHPGVTFTVTTERCGANTGRVHLMLHSDCDDTDRTRAREAVERAVATISSKVQVQS